MIYVDVNIFQYWLTADRLYGDRAKKILRQYRNKITSSLTIWILFILNPGNEEKILEAIEALDIRIAPLRIQEIREAITLSNSIGLDIEDSIHLATMKELGLNEIASNDKDFDKVPWIKRVF